MSRETSQSPFRGFSKQGALAMRVQSHGELPDETAKNEVFLKASEAACLTNKWALKRILQTSDTPSRGISKKKISWRYPEKSFAPGPKSAIPLEDVTDDEFPEGYGED